MIEIAPETERPPVTPLVEIVVDEDLTAEAALRLHGRLADALRMRPAQLIVDLSGCGYADALAIDVLLNAHRQAYHAGGRLTLRSPSARVQRLLHLARVHQVFHVVTLAR
jgi:anti-anti-sigma factor